MEAWIWLTILGAIIAIAACVWVTRGKRLKESVFYDGTGPLRFGLIIAHPDDEVKSWGFD